MNYDKLSYVDAKAMIKSGNWFTDLAANISKNKPLLWGLGGAAGGAALGGLSGLWQPKKRRNYLGRMLTGGLLGGLGGVGLNLLTSTPGQLQSKIDDTKTQLTADTTAADNLKKGWIGRLLAMFKGPNKGEMAKSVIPGGYIAEDVGAGKLTRHEAAGGAAAGLSLAHSASGRHGRALKETSKAMQAVQDKTGIIPAAGRKLPGLLKDEIAATKIKDQPGIGGKLKQIGKNVWHGPAAKRVLTGKGVHPKTFPTASVARIPGYASSYIPRGPGIRGGLKATGKAGGKALGFGLLTDAASRLLDPLWSGDERRRMHDKIQAAEATVQTNKSDLAGLQKRLKAQTGTAAAAPQAAPQTAPQAGGPAPPTGPGPAKPEAGPGPSEETPWDFLWRR